MAKGRVEFMYIRDYPSALRDVRLGSRVIVDFDVITSVYNMKAFSLTGDLVCRTQLGLVASDQLYNGELKHQAETIFF